MLASHQAEKSLKGSTAEENMPPTSCRFGEPPQKLAMEEKEEAQGQYLEVFICRKIASRITQTPTLSSILLKF
jgi:hypothetical protein